MRCSRARRRRESSSWCRRPARSGCDGVGAVRAGWAADGRQVPPQGARRHRPGRAARARRRPRPGWRRPSGSRAGQRPDRWRPPPRRARRGHRRILADPAALGQPGGRGAPLLVGPAADGLHEIAGDVLRAPQYDRLAAVDVGGSQRGEVTVAAVLAQQRRSLPQSDQGLAGDRQFGVRRREHTPGEIQVLGCAPQQACCPRCLGLPAAQQAPQRGCRARLADRDGLLRRDQVPHAGDRPGHKGRREVVERRGHHGRLRAA